MAWKMRYFSLALNVQYIYQSMFYNYEIWGLIYINNEKPFIAPNKQEELRQNHTSSLSEYTYSMRAWV